jgi:hypothetical protein
VNDHEFEGTRRVTFEGGATFVPVCQLCFRFVKCDDVIYVGSSGLREGANATCSKCGRTEMIFEGFYE